MENEQQKPSFLERLHSGAEKLQDPKEVANHLAARLDKTLNAKDDDNRSLASDLPAVLLAKIEEVIGLLEGIACGRVGTEPKLISNLLEVVAGTEKLGLEHGDSLSILVDCVRSIAKAGLAVDTHRNPTAKRFPIP